MQNSVADEQPKPTLPKVPVGRQVLKTQDAPTANIRVCKSGDRIESIVVTCACGQEITLNCDYESQEIAQ